MTRLHDDFYPEIHLVATKLVSIETSSKVATGPLASGDLQVTLSHVECLPQSLALDLAGSLVTLRSHFTRVVLRSSHGTSTMPLAISSPKHRTISLWTSTETTTKPSRRWQPQSNKPTGLQDDHLVPLDATSRCNRTRIAHSLDRMNTINHK
jgi:hypothetical protein